MGFFSLWAAFPAAAPPITPSPAVKACLLAGIVAAAGEEGLIE